MTVRYCGQCGGEAADGERFCVACGTRLRDPGAAPEATPPAARDDDTIALEHAVRRLAEGDAKTAVTVLERLRDERPEWAVARAYLGTAYLRLARVADARDELERAVALAPSSFICRYRYGEYLARLGFYDQALRELDAALAVPPPDATTARAVGELREFCKARMKGLVYRDLRARPFHLRNLLPRGLSRPALKTTERVP